MKIKFLSLNEDKVSSMANLQRYLSLNEDKEDKANNNSCILRFQYENKQKNKVMSGGSEIKIMSPLQQPLYDRT